VGVKRKQHSSEFKARVAMAALSREKTLAELSVEFGVHPTMISNWKQELVKRAGELFARGSKAPARRDNPDAIAPLRVDDGQYLTVGHPEQDAALLAVGFAFVDPLAMANASLKTKVARSKLTR